MRAIVFVTALIACGPSPAPKGPAVDQGNSLDEIKGNGIGDSLNPARPDNTVEADKMTLHVINVGQGLSLLFEFPCGAVLVDTGGEDNELFHSTKALDDYLHGFFARRSDLNDTLSALYITHPHIDHTRGIDSVLENFKIENVVTNGQELKDLGGRPQIRLHKWVIANNRKGSFRKIGFTRLDSESIPEQGLTNEVIDPVSSCDASTIDPELRAFWGQVSNEHDYSKNPNDHSVVLRVSFGEGAVLTTGDLELEGLDHLGRRYQGLEKLLDVDVYVVGHHGSKNATAPHLMESMTPKVAVISAGPYERDLPWTARKYGHPNVRAIDELRDLNYGVSWFRKSKPAWIGISGAWNDRPSVFERQPINRAIYSTGWDGTIDVRVYSNAWVEVETEK